MVENKLFQLLQKYNIIIITHTHQLLVATIIKVQLNNLQNLILLLHILKSTFTDLFTNHNLLMLMSEHILKCINI